MTLWQRLTGRVDDTPETRDAFATKVAARMRAHGVESTYEREAFQLRSGLGVVFLGNVFVEYCRAGWMGRRRVVETIAGPALMARDDVPEDYASVRPRLRPVLRDRDYFAQAAGDGEVRYEMPFEPVADVYGFGVVVDTPTFMKYVNTKQLEEWGVPFNQALADARSNIATYDLPAFTTRAPRDGAGRFLHCTANDGYATSRLAAPRFLADLDLPGAVVIVPIDRDQFVVAGAGDAAGLKAALEFVAMADDGPRRVRTVALRLWGERLVPHTVEAPAALGIVVDRARDLALAQLANAQKDQLDREYEATGRDVYVAAVGAFEEGSSGRLLTYVTWAKEVPTLLTPARRVVLADPSTKRNVSEATVSWEELQRVCGHLLKREGDTWPERWLTTGFPTHEEIAELAASVSRSG